MNKYLVLVFCPLPLFGCDANIERWRVDAAIAACKDRGGIYQMETWINSVECSDGKIAHLERAK